MKKYIKSAIVICILSLSLMDCKVAVNTETIKLKNDEFHVLMGYKGSLEGAIRHNPIRSVAFAEKENDIVYGFTEVDDKITWTVSVPEAADYLVAIQYTGKKFHSEFNKGVNPDCTVEVIANKKVLSMELNRLTHYNEAPSIAGTRQWFDGVLPLIKGTNEITFHP